MTGRDAGPKAKPGNWAAQDANGAKCLALGAFAVSPSPVDKPKPIPAPGRPSATGRATAPGAATLAKFQPNPGAVDCSRATRKRNLTAQATDWGAKRETIDPKRVALTSGGNQARRRHRFRRSPGRRRALARRLTGPAQLAERPPPAHSNSGQMPTKSGGG
jgi:hypothetical protein